MLNKNTAIVAWNYHGLWRTAAFFLKMNIENIEPSSHPLHERLYFKEYFLSHAIGVFNQFFEGAKRYIFWIDKHPQQ